MVVEHYCSIYFEYLSYHRSINENKRDHEKIKSGVCTLLLLKLSAYARWNECWVNSIWFSHCQLKHSIGMGHGHGHVYNKFSAH